MIGFIYKMDGNGNRLSRNYTAELNKHENSIYICLRDPDSELPLKKGDIVYFFDEDIELGSNYNVIAIQSVTMLEVKAK